MSVFDAAISTIMKNPAGTSSAVESHSARENENAINVMPKHTADTAAQRPSPRTFWRTVSKAAPARAPTPDAAINKPYAFGPPLSTLDAITGMSTLYGIPIKLTRPSSSNNARTGLVFHEYTNPSMMLSHADT